MKSSPAAKAIAKANLTQLLTHIKLHLYTMEAGQPCSALLHDVGYVLAILGMASEKDPAVGPHDPRARVLRGALSAISQLLETDRWDLQAAVPIETGLLKAEELNKVLQTKYIVSAMTKAAPVMRRHKETA